MLCMYVIFCHTSKLKFKLIIWSEKRKGRITIFTSIEKLIGKQLNIYLKHPQFQMAGIALKGHCDLVSIMVPPEVSLKEKCLRKRKNILSKKFRRNTAFSRLLRDCANWPRQIITLSGQGHIA